jgi:dihydrofolate reductase
MGQPLVNVIGLVATDMNKNICFENKHGYYQTISFHQEITKSARNLDGNFLRSTISDYSEKSIAVVGEETYKQMGKLLDRFRFVITSNKNGATFVTRKETANGLEQREIRYENGDELSDFATSLAIKWNVENILVLGGRSVYHAFGGLYTSVTNTVFKTEIEGETKEVNIGDAESGMMVSRSNRKFETIYSSDNLEINHYGL